MQSYISREQDYALRISAHLAGLKSSEQLSIGELSRRLFIPKTFAAKIVHKLKHGGIVGTNQGKNGGIYLAREATRLSVYDVLQTIGFTTQFNKCFSVEFKCELMRYCKYHGFFASQEEKLFEAFKSAYVSEFV